MLDIKEITRLAYVGRDVTPSDYPRGTRILLDKDGNPEPLDYEPASVHRMTTASCLKDLQTFIEEWSLIKEPDACSTSTAGDPDPLFYHVGRNEIVLFNANEAAACSLPLTDTAPFEFLARADALPGDADARYTQKDLVDILRIKFASCGAGELLTAVENMVWSTTLEKSANYQPTNRIEAALSDTKATTGARGPIPTAFTFSVPLFRQTRGDIANVPIKCAIVVGTDEKRIDIRPLDGQVDAALATFRLNAVPFFASLKPFGKPTVWR